MFTNHWYKQIFAPAPAHALPADFTPEYSTLPEEGVAHVASFLPRAKAIYLIRDPADRAISQLRMNLMREKRRPASLADWLREAENPVLAERGDYATYIPRWQRHFGDRLLILPYGRIARDPDALMQQVETHLGIGPFVYAGLRNKVFAAPEGEMVPPPEVRTALRTRFAAQYDYLNRAFPKDFVAQLG